MRKKIALLITILLLGYGIIRIFVGGALLVQTLQVVNFSELSDASLEVEQFIDTRVPKQIIPFTLTGYYIYILVMGLSLATGALGVIIRKKWGFILLWIYIASHAALFINFQEINPKIFGLVLQVILLISLTYLLPYKQLNKL